MVLSATSQLTADQARALWDAGGFFVLTGLPEGSEYGVDGTFHIVRRFSGTKFVPPGLHLFTWSAAPSPSSLAGNVSVPIRSGLVRFFTPKQRVALVYDPALEDVPLPSSSSAVPTPPEESTSLIEVIGNDRLVSLDTELAPYPFEGLEQWKSLTIHITAAIVETVLGPSGRIDGLTHVDGDVDLLDDLETRGKRKRAEGEEDANERVEEKGMREKEVGVGGMKFPKFDLKRSFRAEARGEEVTRFSQDKSWLLVDVAARHGGVTSLIAYLQLSFVLLIYVSSYSSLVVYKRLLVLFCRSSSILTSPSSLLPQSPSPSSLTSATIRSVYIALLHTLAAQLAALPETAFDTELPEMDRVLLEETDNLRRNLAAAMHLAETRGGVFGASNGEEGGIGEVKDAWEGLQMAGKRFGWAIGDLGVGGEVEDDDDEEEEGEYAPVIVEM